MSIEEKLSDFRQGLIDKRLYDRACAGASNELSDDEMLVIHMSTCAYRNLLVGSTPRPIIVADDLLAQIREVADEYRGNAE